MKKQFFLLALLCLCYSQFSFAQFPYGHFDSETNTYSIYPNSVNFAVGTTKVSSPEVKTEFVGNSLRYRPQEGSSMYLDITGITNTLGIYAYNQDFSLQSVNGNMWINPMGGKLTIGEGTVTPNNFLLGVHGEAIFEGVFVQRSEFWPDYVFAQDYQLMPLPELANFLKANQHLPHFPPACTIEENGGFYLGEMQKSTVRTVEELVLHTIQLNEKLGEALQLIEQMTKRVEQLEKR